MKVSAWFFGSVDFDSTVCSLRSAYSSFPESTESPCPDSGQRARHHHPQPASQPPELGVSGGSCTLQTENDPMCVDKLTVHKTAGIPTLKEKTHPLLDWTDVVLWGNWHFAALWQYSHSSGFDMLQFDWLHVYFRNGLLTELFWSNSTRMHNHVHYWVTGI